MSAFDHKYILYLQLTRELPENFFLFTEYLAKWNISLVPIRPEELRSMPIAKPLNIIAVTHSLGAWKRFNYLRKHFLDFALLNGRFRMFHMSSYGKISIFHRLHRKNSYCYYQLPMGMLKVSEDMARTIYKEKFAPTAWPGGKRAKLPSIS